MIPSLVGRRSILSLILVGFLIAFAVLWWVGHGGAISYQTAAPAIKRLLEHYIPMLAILAGFYFSERATLDEGHQTSLESFVFAVMIVAVWVFAPPILIAASDTVEGSMRLLESITGVGTSLTSACLVFYFSKSAKMGGSGEAL